MATFKYIAIDKSKVLKEGEIEAPSRDRVLDFLRGENLKPVSIKEKKVSAFSRLFFRKIKKEQLIVLVEGLSVMLSSGVSLPEAIEVLEKDEINPSFKRILGTLKFGLESGRPFSKILSGYPKVFSPIFVGLVKAGEKSGNLDQTFKNLEIQLKKEVELSTKIRTALIYPSILIFAIVGVLILLFTLVLPKIGAVFKEANLELPLITKLLLWLSQILGFNPWLTFSVIFVVCLTSYFLLRLKAIKNLFLLFFNRLPLVSSVGQKLDLARFSRTLGLLLKSGIPIVEALDLTKEALSLRFRPLLPKIIEEVKKGVSLTNALKKEMLFPRLLVSTVSIGEKTGKTDQILIELAQFYERALDTTLKNLVSLIEPLLLLIVGAVIGAIALSIVLPIYQLIGKLGG